MAKRFTSTEIWEEDWFLEMPNEYKLFWYYMLSNCDHAGIFKVNLRSFCGLNEVKISAEQILSFFNNGKDRIRVVNQSLWYVEDFFSFQYGETFNINNPMHRGVKKQLEKSGIELTSIRGLKEVNLTIKEKEKEKDIKERFSNTDIGNGTTGSESPTEEGGTGETKINPDAMIPKMQMLWYETIPTYTKDVANDYPAIVEIYKFIASQANLRDITNPQTQDKVLGTLQLIAIEASEDDFWRVKPLKSISKNIQEFYNRIKDKKNGQPRNSKINGKSVKHSDDDYKAALTKSFAQRR